MTSAKSGTKRTAEPSRHPWSWLLQRVFAVDLLKCEKCGGRLRIVEIANKPDDITRVLGERSYARAPPRETCVRKWTLGRTCDGVL